MKLNLIVAALIGQSCLVSAQSLKQEPFLTKTLSGLGIREVFVNTSGGSITVSGGTDGQARVEVYVNGNNGQPLSKEEVKKRLEESYFLEVEAHDGELHATAKNKRMINWGNNGLSISFKVYVPEKVATNLNTSGGSIHLDHLTGTERFTTSGGSLHADHLTGDIKGRTSGGSIQIADSRNNIDMETSGGSVTAENCSGTIRLETSGGSLTMNNLKGAVSAHTSGGSVHGDNIAGELITGTSGGSINLSNLSCALDASTSAGSLHAAFKEVGKYVKLDVSAGHIDLSLPAKQGLDLDLRGNRMSDLTLNNFSGEHSRDAVRGKVNGGGPLVRADAGSGRVSLSFN
ncbi:DUF4097 domain-containing protein [Mucilaginibacter sp. RS28]|uniref:DUF4097 domain-containing protein n=1 Tax=Mucilaginibacter straminoryzae TaxID=2932774 RepID=A0A9X2BCR2_9SPHI|nr:DUF4097 family beta strand repeat-containing protein [Mucilaginibacter straminoryzae]MCJ8211247.1 DUF4097 domain-containing protein [Mucilaginibacter straminoryzae]